MRSRRTLLLVTAALAFAAALFAGRAWLARAPAPAVAGAPGPGSAAAGLAGDEARPAQPRPPAAAPAEAAEGELEVQVTARGAPRAGAEVRLWARTEVEEGSGSPGWRRAGTASTDVGGRARLPAAPGTYLVSARAPGLAPAHAVVTRPAGERRTALTLALAPGVAVAGRVVAQGRREPVPLAALALAPRPPGGGRGVPPAPIEERWGATADASGRFRLEGVAPGPALLEARAPGFAAARVPLTAPRGDLEVELRAAAVVEGFVVTAAGAPAPGAEVTLAGGPDLERGTAGPSGGFSLEVGPGTYTLSARRGGDAGALPAPVAAAAGRTTGGLVVRLGAGGVVAGVVRTAQGAPVAGASVGLSPHGHGGEFDRLTTGTDGRFAFEPVAAGGYDLDATADGYTQLVRSGLALLPGQRFEVALVLEGTGAVEGAVTGVAGQPVPGVRVRAERRRGGTDDRPEARTDLAGRYRLTGLERGDWAVAALRDGAAAGPTALVEVKAGAVARADLALGDAGAVEGTVSAARGGPPPRPAIVVLVSGRGPSAPRARVEVAADGRYRAEVPAGSWRVQALYADPPRETGARPAAVEVSAGATARVDLALDEPEGRAGVTVLVLEPSGLPSADAVVWLTEAARERPVTWARTDGEGRARLEDAPERVELLARARNGGRLAPPVRVAAGAATLQLAAAGTLRGRVTSRDGAPVRGFALRLAVDEGLLAAGLPRLDFAEDRFEVPDLPGGALRLAARTEDGRYGEAAAALAPGGAAEVEIALERAAVVSGRLVEPGTGAPLADGFVVGGIEPVEGGADGRFRALVAPGRRRLSLRAPGRARLERELDLAPGADVDLGDVGLARTDR